MLDAIQAATIAFWENGTGTICRACAVKRYGELAVAKVEAGMQSSIDRDLERMMRYEVDERAVDRGWENCDDYSCDGDAKGKNAGERYCSDHGTEDCSDCGKRLDTTAEQEAVLYPDETKGGQTDVA